MIACWPVSSAKRARTICATKSPDGRGLAHAIDTHLFLNGETSDETHARLLTIAARTCYLHATAAASLPPAITIAHNDRPVD